MSGDESVQVASYSVKSSASSRLVVVGRRFILLCACVGVGVCVHLCEHLCSLYVATVSLAVRVFPTQLGEIRLEKKLKCVRSSVPIKG